MVALPPLDGEFEPWVLGHRKEVGVFLGQDRRFVYLQLYEINEPTLVLLLANLSRWASQLEVASRG